MLFIHCHLQQEIGEASDDAARKYYDETPLEDRTDTGVTAAMRAAAKSRHHTFKGQFFKYLSIANPKFGDKFLEEVGFSFMIPLQCFIIQYRPSFDIPWHCCRSRSTGATTRSLRCHLRSYSSLQRPVQLQSSRSDGWRIGTRASTPVKQSTSLLKDSPTGTLRPS
jgi:hypothetical protein